MKTSTYVVLLQKWNGGLSKKRIEIDISINLGYSSGQESISTTSKGPLRTGIGVSKDVMSIKQHYYFLINTFIGKLIDNALKAWSIELGNTKYLKNENYYHIISPHS